MNKLKKSISILLVFLMAFVVMPSFNQAKADTVVTPQKGTYIQFGHYNGVPIVWRVLDVNKKGLMLLSDKIITLKAFDVAESGHYDKDSGTYKNDSEKYVQESGSNRWKNSNLREWLNSDSQTVRYSTQPPTNKAVWNGFNDYNKEVGFLTNFTTDEKSAIKEVQNKTEVFDVNTEKIIDAKDITNDKVFLLSFDDANKYFKSDSERIASLTAESERKARLTVENAQNSEHSVKSGNDWYCWLRSPSHYCSYIVNYVNGSGGISDGGNADDGSAGVRPALYLKSKISISSGNGTVKKPYILRASKSTTNKKISKYINPYKLTITINKGKTYLNKIYGIYDGKTKVDLTKQVIAKSSNNKVVKTLKNGYIQGVNKGNVKITVQYKTMKCSYKVIVK